MPVLLYAVEACPVNRSLYGSLEFHKNFNENYQNKIQRNCH